MKLDPAKGHYDQELGWVGDPACEGKSEKECEIIRYRYLLDIIGGITDPDASYSYDEWALCRLPDGTLWMLSTSGCSCPSPSETWQVEIGPATADEIRAHIKGGHYDGYTMPKKHEDQFLALIDKAESKND